MVAQEFQNPIWAQESHSKRPNEDQLPNLNHFPRLIWNDWIKELSKFKYAIHLMPTVAAGTFSLNCAYFGIPCIGNELVDTQLKCFPDLAVNVEDVNKARILAQRLRDDKEFYQECSLKAIENYHKYYNVENMESQHIEHTVIIPSHNTLLHLQNTYISLLKYGGGVKIIIIDDASEDNTAEWLNTLDNPNLQVVISPERKGHTFWYDEGMRMSTTDIVSILHSDMVIGPNYFENLLKHLEPGKVVCATRIEPPIHPAGREKIVMDFGG